MLWRFGRGDVEDYFTQASGQVLNERPVCDLCLVHLHLPRTGGTTLRHALLPLLLEQIRPDQIFLVDIGPEHSCRSGSLSDLRALPAQERNRLRFVTGHFPLSAIEYLPASVPFAVIRSPVDRALSDYWYSYHESANPAHSAARSMSAAAFCAAGFGHARNGQARYLSGMAFEEGSPDNEELYVQAQQALGKLRLCRCVRKLRADT
jgi:hypothetical protein